MARIETDPNYTATTPALTRATAVTDLFKATDVQGVAAALTAHNHNGGGNGLLIAPPANSLNGAVLLNGSVGTAQIANGNVTRDKMANSAQSRMFVVTGVTASPSTTSMVPVDMPDMAITFGSPYINNSFFWFSGTFLLSGGVGVLTMELDGTAALVNYIQQTGINYTISSCYAVGPLATGTHTLKMRWWLTAAGTLTATATYRAMSLLEIAQ